MITECTPGWCCCSDVLAEDVLSACTDAGGTASSSELHSISSAEPLSCSMALNTMHSLLQICLLHQIHATYELGKPALSYLLMSAEVMCRWVKVQLNGYQNSNGDSNSARHTCSLKSWSMLAAPSSDELRTSTMSCRPTEETANTGKMRCV